MTIAPVPQLSAALEVLYWAALDARVLSHEDHTTGLPPVQRERLADLMVAIHTIPLLLTEWKCCDESLLRIMLAAYDERWSGSLLAHYDRMIANLGAAGRS